MSEQTSPAVVNRLETPVSPRPLAASQQELLDAMKAGVRVHYMRYMGSFNPTAYYFRADNYKRCTAAADALIAKGLAKRVAEGRQEVLVLA